MPREKTFIVLLVSFLLGGAVLGYLKQRTHLVQYALQEDYLEPSPQRAEGRVVRAARFDERHASETEEGGLLLEALDGRADREGNVLLFDWGDQAIKKLSARGELLTSYRLSPPEGAEPLVALTDFAVSESGELWVVRAKGTSVEVYDAQGRFLESFAIAGSPHRIALGPDGAFVVMTLPTDGEIFQSYAPDGVLLQSFGRPLAGDFQHPILLDGMIDADDRGGFVYAPFYVPLLAAYTAGGELRFVVATIGATPGPLPAVLVGPDGRQNLAPGTPGRTRAVHVAGGRIYVLSERGIEISRQAILDVYSEDDGSYLDSILLPDRPQDALVVAGRLVTIEESRLRSWELPAVP